MKRRFWAAAVFLLVSAGLLVAGGAGEKSPARKKLTFGFLYQDLETEFWVAVHKAVTETLKKQGIEVLEFNAHEDANKQLEQLRDAIAQGVDAVFLVAQDGESAVTMAATANEAGVPIGLFGRPPANKSKKAIVATSSEIVISTGAMEHMVKEARKKYQATGKKLQPCIIVGDLGDVNAVDRRKGFYQVLEKNMDIFETPVEVPSKWDSNVALANFQAAMRANPGIDFLFVSSDFLYPQVKAVLEPLGKWKPIGDPNHVIMCGIDGDLTAGRLMDEKIVDATGVHDLYGMAYGMMNKLLEAIEKGEKTPNDWTAYPGFALTQENMAQRRMDMWGNILRAAKGEIKN